MESLHPVPRMSPSGWNDPHVYPADTDGSDTCNTVRRGAEGRDWASAAAGSERVRTQSRLSKKHCVGRCEWLKVILRA